MTLGSHAAVLEGAKKEEPSAGLSTAFLRLANICTKLTMATVPRMRLMPKGYDVTNCLIQWINRIHSNVFKVVIQAMTLF